MLSVCHQAFCACDCQVSCAQDVVSSLFCLFVAMIGMLGGCLVCAVLCFVVFCSTLPLLCVDVQLNSPLLSTVFCVHLVCAFLLPQIWQFVHCFILLASSRSWSFFLFGIFCVSHLFASIAVSFDLLGLHVVMWLMGSQIMISWWWKLDQSQWLLVFYTGSHKVQVWEQTLSSFYHIYYTHGWNVQSSIEWRVKRRQ